MAADKSLEPIHALSAPFAVCLPVGLWARSRVCRALPGLSSSFSAWPAVCPHQSCSRRAVPDKPHHNLGTNGFTNNQNTTASRGQVWKRDECPESHEKRLEAAFGTSSRGKKDGKPRAGLHSARRRETNAQMRSQSRETLRVRQRPTNGPKLSHRRALSVHGPKIKWPDGRQVQKLILAPK